MIKTTYTAVYGHKQTAVLFLQAGLGSSDELDSE
jgi:hypothetical protein